VGPTQPPVCWEPGILSLGWGRWPRHEVDHSPISSAEIKNEWQNTYAPSYAFMVFKETTYFLRNSMNLAVTCVIIYNTWIFILSIVYETFDKIFCLLVVLISLRIWKLEDILCCICTGSPAYLGNYWVVLRICYVVRDLVPNNTCYLFAVSLTL
jgi:hypothetical protein